MNRVVHFEIGVEEPSRAKKFYERVFGWKFEKWSGPMEYWMIDTGKDKDGINGGMMKRKSPEDKVVNTVDVDSVDDFVKKIEKAGGKILVGKTTVPGVGYMAYCADTEGNPFGVMENDKSAK
jgi:hypothetical protein